MTFRTRPEQLQHNQRFATQAAACTNVGQTDDEQDLYGVMTAMVTDLEAGYPPFACRSGCNYCCYHPPLVTSLEWQALYPHLQNLTGEQRRAVLGMADLLRPYAPDLLALRQQALDAATAEAMDAPPIQCPLLIDGRCIAYAARPMVCRGYGYTFRQSAGQRAFYGSYLAFLHLKSTFPRDIALPAYDPFAARLGDLNGQAGGTEAFLPQWLWTHIRDGDFVPTMDPNPDFTTA